MAEVRWIKIITDIFDDEKIRLIETLPDADTILIIWFKLLTMAGKCNDSGIIYLTRDIPYNEEMLSTIMRRPVNTVRLALNEFQRLGMISIENNFIALLNWNKHQNLDKIEKLQHDTRVRVQKYRERQKAICNISVTQCNATDIDKDIDIDKIKNKRGVKFTPPTFEEVSQYCYENNINIDIAKFIDYYTSNGWMVAKNKMKDWKAAVRNWSRREFDKPKKPDMQDTYSRLQQEYGK